MDFKNATDLLFASIGHDDLSRHLSSSIAAIRQARLAKTAKAHRAPPKGWEKAVIKLAETKISQLQSLITSLSDHAEG